MGIPLYAPAALYLGKALIIIEILCGHKK